MPDRLKQVVAAEPSLGTLHKHYKLILNGAAATDNNVQTLSVTAELPAGRKAVNVQFSVLSAGTGQTLAITNATGTEIYGLCRTQVANIANDGYCITPVDANGNIYWQVSNFVQETVYLRLEFYDS